MGQANGGVGPTSTESSFLPLFWLTVEQQLHRQSRAEAPTHTLAASMLPLMSRFEYNAQQDRRTDRYRTDASAYIISGRRDQRNNIDTV